MLKGNRRNRRRIKLSLGMLLYEERKEEAKDVTWEEMKKE